MALSMSTDPSTRTPPRILSIAGSDSSGGAGIQADIKTIAMLGGYAMTAITTVTAQNTVGVQAPIVLDPVMIATSGAALIDPQAIEALREKLFPMATLVTPNLPELGHLLGRNLTDSSQMADAAEELAHKTGAAVLAKGGHTSDARIIDILYIPGQDARAVQFDHARIDTPHTHGTGCTLSSAIATLLGHGQPLEHAVRLARNFVRAAIENAPGFGAGNGPLGHHAVRKL